MCLSNIGKGRGEGGNHGKLFVLFLNPNSPTLATVPRKASDRSQTIPLHPVLCHEININKRLSEGRLDGPLKMVAVRTMIDVGWRRPRCPTARRSDRNAPPSEHRAGGPRIHKLNNARTLAPLKTSQWQGLKSRIFRNS